MQIKIYDTGVRLWLSANDTERWASKPGASWPCSQLAGRRLFAEFDRNGLCDLSIDGGRGEQDVDCNEFNALTSDILAKRLDKNHPCYFVIVGQFVEGLAQTRPAWHFDTNGY